MIRHHHNNKLTYRLLSGILTNYHFGDLMLTTKPILSIVIPCFNEQEVIHDCYEILMEVVKSTQLTTELVFIDDGSSDDTLTILLSIQQNDGNVKIVQLSRNFGKEAALTAGLVNTSGDAVIVLDADLQDPPELIPSMIDAWQQGYQIVRMRRSERDGEGFFKLLFAGNFYRILNSISDIDIPCNTGDFGLYSRQVIDNLNNLPEKNRYMKGLFAWVGFKTTVIYFKRAPRFKGKTKWNFFSLITLAIDGITSFSITPLKWITAIGTSVALIGFLFGIKIVLEKLFFGISIPGYSSLFVAISIMGGVQMMMLGIVGIYVGKAYIETKNRPIYIIDKLYNDEMKDDAQH